MNDETKFFLVMAAVLGLGIAIALLFNYFLQMGQLR